MNTNPLVNEKREKVPTARFWEWINGSWVKLSLRGGDKISKYTYRDEDEGFSSEHVEYEYDGEYVVRDWYHSARDCDGPISSHGAEMCLVENLRSVEVYVPPAVPFDIGPESWKHNGKHIMRADWQTYRQTRVRDVFAQRMGY